MKLKIFFFIFEKQIQVEKINESYQKQKKKKLNDATKKKS